jgi:hypothetical protein
MATSVVSSPIRSTTGSPGFRSQRKLSVGTITRKIQTLQDTIESLRQQLVFTRTEEESAPQKVKMPKQIKEKVPAAQKQKKLQESKQEEKDKIPMPWTGQAEFTTCVGLKSQYGLFIQCGKACDMSSASFQIDNHECRFCNDCSKKCDENGKHAVGTIEERIEAGVGKYVNAKTGKKETMYIEVLEKMNITKEEALESAARRGFQIPDWMLEKAEKKRGRPVASGATAASKVAGEVETETKEKKPRQPRAKATTAKATTAKATNKKTAAAKASVATNDTPQKTNSVQSSVCVDLNDNDDDVTPVADSDAAVAASSTPIPQEKEKKKRGRPTKSNAQNNVEESEMQRLIVQATTEKKKRLSLDPSDIAPSSQEEVGQVETQLNFEENGSNKIDEDEIFDMFEKMLEEDEMNQQQEQQQEEVVTAASVVEPVVVVATNEKKEKSKKTKKSDEKVEKVEKKKDDKVSKKEAALAAKKKAEEEALAAAAKKRAEEEDDETEDEEDQEEEEELECEEYEYDGETYGLAPNGDIYSQDGDLVGKLDNGVPQMF